jgi:hypothetical protein
VSLFHARLQYSDEKATLWGIWLLALGDVIYINTVLIQMPFYLHPFNLNIAQDGWPCTYMEQ